jgi:hypothetical protein
MPEDRDKDEGGLGRGGFAASGRRARVMLTPIVTAASMIIQPSR